MTEARFQYHTVNAISFNDPGTYQTTKRFEATGTIRKHQNIIRVRINIVAKALTNTGGIVWSQPVNEWQFYQNLFSKIDKAIFIEKQNI